MLDFKTHMLDFSKAFDKFISDHIPDSPILLYDPIRYISSLPSKKLRPFLVHLFLKGYQNKKITDFQDSDWMILASLEMLHNFTLIHDDIMDEDDWRRGKETVHKKWDINTAILGGDGLLALAFKVLAENTAVNYNLIVQEFSRAVLTVCEGQALDKQFESRKNVKENDYLEMIYKKTGSLIEASCIIGAYAGNCLESEHDHIRTFGKNLGFAFQVQDDYLDIFGAQTDLGKDLGSDIQMRKKTLIMIKIMENPKVLAEIDSMILKSVLPLDDVRTLLEESGIANETRQKVRSYTQKAKEILDLLSINKNEKKILWELADYLEQRSH